MAEPIKDENGYWRGKPEHSDLISRKIAYDKIFLKNRDKYPLPFSQYVVHHIDGDKDNNGVNNLYICTKEQHNIIHQEQKTRKKRFANASEIDYFLRSRRDKEQATLSATYYKGKKEYKQLSKTEKDRIKKAIAKIKREEQIKKEIEREEQRKIYQENLRREREKARKIIIAVCIIVAVILLIFILTTVFKKPEPSISANYTQANNTVPIPEAKPVVVESTGTEVIITNNQQESISLNVSYRIYSSWYGVDYTTSQIFDVGANSKQTFKVYNNDGLSMGIGSGSVTIISYSEIES